MRKGWIALTVCAGVAAGFAWGTSEPSQATMVIGASKADMSLVEPVARKKRSNAVCTQKLIFTCCTEPGKQEYCDIK